MENIFFWRERESKKHLIASFIIAAGVLLGGCGGGGDSGSESISGVAIDGYIRDAKVCLDKNYNFACDSDEPSTTTGSGGRFTLGVSPSELNNYPLVAEAGSGSFDEGRGFYFTTPLKLTAPSGVTTITPITTLIQGKISQGKSRSEAESEVASLLGISSNKLYIDYEASNDTTLQSKAYNIATIMQSNGNSISSTISALGGGGSGSSSSDSGGSSDNGGDGDTPTVSVSANDFTYGTAIGNSAKTFNWKTLSSASSSDSSTLGATVKSQGSKGTATIDGDNLTYTPSSGQSGTDAFIITISNTSSTTKDITITVNAIDTVAPTVTSTAPSSGATNVAINTAVSVTFSEEMDASTVGTDTGSLKDSMDNSVAGSVSVSLNTFTFTPSSALSYDTAYTATLTTAMKDINGNSLADDYTWSFTTGSTPDTTPPTLDSTTPTNNATGVQANSYITLSFSEAIKPSSATSSSIVLKDGSNNTVPTTLSFDNTSTIRVTPDSNLSTGATYTLTITTAITDDADNALTAPQTLTFTTINTAPSADDSTYGTAIGGSAKTFNWKTLSSATDSDGHALSATVKTQGTKGTSTIDGDNITYTPSANQSGSDTIVITISDTLGGTKDITITVTGIDTVPPTISATYPTAGATSVGVYTWVDINFSEPMDSTTLTTANITISGGKTCQSIEYNTATYSARCYPYVTTASHKLADSTGYTITVTTNVKDSNGNAIANTGNTLSFTTGIENKLPRLRTGQTTSYADYDDGWYVTNGGLGIARSFTDNGDTVTDSVTGLEWQDNGAGGTPTWANAGTYCENLTLGGQSDWRLPSIEELVTIANKGAFNSSKFTEFQNVTSSGYWSATTNASITSDAWNVYFLNGNDYWGYKTFFYYVLCVRGGQ